MKSSTKKLRTCSETTHLLSLPNELLKIILEYLSPVDLIQCIFSLNHSRFNALIYPFISRVDLTKFPHQDLKSIFMLISSTRIDSKQIHAIRLAPALRSLILIQTDPSDLGFLSFLPHFARHLNSLSLHLHKNHNIDKFLLPALLFQANCSLETLTIQSNKTPIFFELDHIVPCPTMKRLTLSLAIDRHLLILCEHLPSLEYLEILSFELLVSDVTDYIFNCDEYVLQKPVSKYLCEFKIDGYVHFARIEQFIQLFASSLQYLTLRLGISDESINGHRLEKRIINVCTELKKFKFYLCMNGNKNRFVDFESFQPAHGNYWSTHPVVCFGQMVASLPFTEWYFRSFGNAFPNEIQFNCSDPPPFRRVRQIELAEYDGPLSLGLFKFVERFFTHANSLYISSECRLADFDWTLLPRFPRVKTLSMYMYYPTDDEIDLQVRPTVALLRAFFSLVPNLRRWRTSITFLKEYETLLRTDQQLRDVLESIQELQMSPDDDKQLKEFVQSLFPNAIVRFDFTLWDMYHSL